MLPGRTKPIERRSVSFADIISKESNIAFLDATAPITDSVIPGHSRPPDPWVALALPGHSVRKEKRRLWSPALRDWTARVGEVLPMLKSCFSIPASGSMMFVRITSAVELFFWDARLLPVRSATSSIPRSSLTRIEWKPRWAPPFILKSTSLDAQLSAFVKTRIPISRLPFKISSIRSVPLENLINLAYSPSSS